MSVRRLCVALTLLCSHSATPAAALPDAELRAAVPGYLQQYAVPGAGVALIREGRLAWVQGFGLAEAGSGRRVTADTRFNAGSISKSLTAWGVLKLVRQQKLALDQPIGTVLTRWKLPASSFRADQVTPRRLLSHTAGISSHGYEGSEPKLPLPPVEDVLNGKTGSGVVSLVSPPGSQIAYSGANYLILQLAIEEVSGRAFQQFMADDVFTPLGMTHSLFDLPADARQMATPHDGFGKPLPLLRYRELPAAGLTTSARDLARFAVAILRDRQTQDLAFHPVANTQWADRDPFGPAPQYGLGFTVRPEQRRGHAGIGHGGTNTGWEGWFQVIPHTGDGIVILTNSASGSAVIASVLCDWRRQADKSAPCPAIEVRIPVLAEYRARGVDAALALHEKLRASQADRYDLSSRQLNSLGYLVMRSGDVAAAVRVFERNASLFPQEWNVHDSLGEAYVAAQRREAAIRSYLKSLELNPHSDSGKQALSNLGHGLP
jgi:CubicO group peptidase (beta-lactamase class C family)